MLIAENRGVRPDIKVSMSPADWRAGRDLQLERAVEIAMKELQKSPRRVKRLEFPIYK